MHLPPIENEPPQYRQLLLIFLPSVCGLPPEVLREVSPHTAIVPPVAVAVTGIVKSNDKRFRVRVHDSLISRPQKEILNLSSLREGVSGLNRPIVRGPKVVTDPDPA